MAVVRLPARPGSVAIAVLAVVLLLGASAAIWVTLTNRGGTRIAGAAASALAVAGLVVVSRRPTGRGWSCWWPCSRCSRCSASPPVTRSGVPAHRPSSTSPDRRPSRRPAGGGAAVLIINLKSGGGKAARFRLAGEARRRGIEPVILEPGDDLLQLAEDAVDRGARVIGMAGGDGSQALVATVAARRDVPHVCIPAGTRNHFALDLGLDRDDVVGALDAYTDGRERRIDLARVNDRVFVNNASLGVYAKVVQSPAYRDAKLQTWAEMLPSLLGPEAPPIDLEFTTPDGTSYADAPLVLVSNNPYRLTSLAGAGTRGRLDEGVLGVFAARVLGPGDVSRLVALELAGQASRFPGLLTWSATEFEVRSRGPVEVGLDGEALVMEPPLRFVSMPGALRVRTPRNAGLSPGARAVTLSRENLAELVRVAAGR